MAVPFSCALQQKWFDVICCDVPSECKQLPVTGRRPKVKSMLPLLLHVFVARSRRYVWRPDVDLSDTRIANALMLASGW